MQIPIIRNLYSVLVRFASCCTSDFFHSENLQINSKLLTKVYIYHKLWKTFQKVFRSYSVQVWCYVVSVSYLDLLLSIGGGGGGQLHTSIYGKRDDFNFHITNFPLLSSNTPTSPAYQVFTSMLIRYARSACFSYGCFILRATRLSNKLLRQGYVKERLKSSLRKFYGRYGNLIKENEVSLSQMIIDIVWLDHIQWQPPTDQTVPNSTFYRILNGFHRTFATGVACRQGTLTPPDTWSRPFWTCICSICWNQNFSLFSRCSSNIPRFFLDFASRICILRNHSSKCLRLSCLQTKEVKDKANFILSGPNIMKSLRRRPQYNPHIIEKSIGLVFCPFKALYRSFLKRCTLTDKAVGTIWRAWSTPLRSPDPHTLWLLVGTLQPSSLSSRTDFT